MRTDYAELRSVWNCHRIQSENGVKLGTNVELQATTWKYNGDKTGTLSGEYSLISGVSNSRDIKAKTPGSLAAAGF